MKTSLLKKVFKKVKGNKIVRFLLFLLVSCSLWLSLTLNRVYETNISVCVHVRNIPAGVKLENGEQYEVNARVKGNGTDLFAYIFSDGLNVDVDYSKFVRNGGNLAMSLKTIREGVVNILNTDLVLQGFSQDSLRATVRKASAMVPVVKTAKDNHLVFYEYMPDSVLVTSFVDVLPSITAVHTEPLEAVGLTCDTVFELRVLHGKHMTVSPEVVKVHADVAQYVEVELPVLVEYVEFPNNIHMNFLPQKATVRFEALEFDTDKIQPVDFTVRLFYEDYLEYIKEGAVASVFRSKFKVECNSPYVRNVELLPIDFTDFSLVFNFAKMSSW